MQIVLITGISGAGKSQAVKCFEDYGYYCVDNLPPALIENFAELCMQSVSKINKAAMVMDVRGNDFFKELVPVIETMKKLDVDLKIIFLEAENNVIIDRFKETRRRHPLGKQGTIAEDIKAERKMLEDIKGKSDIIIDTTNLKPRELHDQLIDLVIRSAVSTQMTIHLVSFGFKYGIPKDADILLDVRFLPNPYYIPEIKRLTGNDVKVQNYVFSHEAAHVFLNKTCDLLEFLIPNYVKEGKKHLQIAIGCTGGRHRSVSLLNKIYGTLLKDNYEIILRHRDIDK
jgi:UPF0042 nucleotide-binding protein